MIAKQLQNDLHKNVQYVYDFLSYFNTVDYLNTSLVIQFFFINELSSLFNISPHPHSFILNKLFYYFFF